ncbi:MAG: Hsp20/alpha crystallin family protein [Verrucomicrobiota bacterium]
MNTLTKTEKEQAATRPSPDWARHEFLLPPVNINETKDGYMLEAEMPGVNKEGLEVLLEGNELTLVGRRQTEVEGASLVYRESSPRHFRRTFVLDPSIDTAHINARMENGVLKLWLPKAEQVKPRRIAISD